MTRGSPELQASSVAHPAIWGRVEHLYPGVSNIANADKLRTLVDLEPSPGESIVVLDTSDWDAKCEPMRGSWQNQQSADLAISVAITAAAESPEPLRIAIITPYRAQVRLLQQRLRAESKAVNKPYDQFVMEAGTVHQFQGSDADVVIFDLVDGRGRTSVGKLLRDDAEEPPCKRGDHKGQRKARGDRRQEME